MILDALLDRLHVFKRHPLLAWPLVAGNLWAVWWGYTIYYDYQLSQTPTHLRPFVADSPNAILLFAVAVILYQFRLRHPLLDLLAWIANVKVGLWTAFILLYYFDEYFSRDYWLRWFLFVLHIGMVAQAWALHKDLRTKPLSWGIFAAAVAWFFVGDWLDYGPYELHPCMPGCDESLAYPVVATVTVLLTVVVLAWAAWWYRPGAPRTAGYQSAGH